MPGFGLEREQDLVAVSADKQYLEAREDVAITTANAFFDLFSARLALDNAVSLIGTTIVPTPTSAPTPAPTATAAPGSSVAPADTQPPNQCAAGGSTPAVSPSAIPGASGALYGSWLLAA